MLNYCQNCSNPIYLRVYYCDNCLQMIISNINNLNHSDIKSKKSKIQNFFPEILIENMTNFLKKDINENLRCLACNLWTASVLMSARIFENELKTHINADLKINKDLRNIGECIDELENVNYPSNFLDQLDELRELRNDAMHGQKRFSSEDSIIIFKKVLNIITWIYNIIPS